MKMNQTVFVTEEDFARINRFLHATKDTGVQGDSNITYTVKFPDGIEADLSCCGSIDGPSWAEVVLFNHGCEVACSQPSDNFLGPWEIDFNGNTYAIAVCVKETPMVPDQKKNDISVTIRALDGRQMTLPLGQLMKLAGFSKNAVPCMVQFSTQKDGRQLLADISLEPDFPGIRISGYSNKKMFDLAGVELPNEDNPNEFVARLYAGCTEYESDAPVAMVKSNADGMAPTGAPYTADDELTKNVFVNRPIAQPCCWNAPEPLPEHKED